MNTYSFFSTCFGLGILYPFWSLFGMSRPFIPGYGDPPAVSIDHVRQLPQFTLHLTFKFQTYNDLFHSFVVKVKNKKLSQDWILDWILWINIPTVKISYRTTPKLQLRITKKTLDVKINTPTDWYLTIWTEPEVNNCFIIYARSDLNRTRKVKPIGLIDGWIHAWTCCRKDSRKFNL